MVRMESFLLKNDWPPGKQMAVAQTGKEGEPKGPGASQHPLEKTLEPVGLAELVTAMFSEEQVKVSTGYVIGVAVDLGLSPSLSISPDSTFRVTLEHHYPRT